jgi:hypothetical protein
MVDTLHILLSPFPADPAISPDPGPSNSKASLKIGAKCFLSEPTLTATHTNRVRSTTGTRASVAIVRKLSKRVLERSMIGKPAAQPVNMGPNNEFTALVRKGMPKRKLKLPEMSRRPQTNGRVDNKKRALVIEDDEQSVDTTEGEKVTWRVRDGDEREVEIKIKSTYISTTVNQRIPIFRFLIVE